MEIKARVNLSIDANVIEQCRQKGLNISNLCECHLRDILLHFEKQTLPENCDHKWSWGFGTAFGIAKECLKCREIKRMYVN